MSDTEFKESVEKFVKKVTDEVHENLVELFQRVASLERITDDLASTNFLLDADIVDEELRGRAIAHINRKAKQASERYVASKRLDELYEKRLELEREMAIIEQDFPTLKDMYK